MTPQQIRTIRAWFNLTQEQLGERVGVSQNTVARWEMGQRHPGGPARLLLGQLWEQMQGEQEAA